jgi:LysM repeat protein
MPTHPRSYSPVAAEKLRHALLALAAAATATVAGTGCTVSGSRSGEPDSIPLGGVFIDDTIETPTPPPPLVPLAPKDGFSIHVVTVGDSHLLSVAKRYGITLAALLAANPQIDDPDYIRCGQQLYVPESKPSPPSERGLGKTAGKLPVMSRSVPEPRLAGAPPPPPRADGSASEATSSGSSRSLPPKDGYTIYVVKSGDTLSAIAQRHEVLQKSIVEANGIADPNRIRAGQPLYIPTQKDPSYTQRTGGAFSFPLRIPEPSTRQ